jgi:hypothetical protein
MNVSSHDYDRKHHSNIKKCLTQTREGLSGGQAPIELELAGSRILLPRAIDHKSDCGKNRNESQDYEDLNGTCDQSDKSYEALEQCDDESDDRDDRSAD